MGPTVAAGSITAATYPMANTILAITPTATSVMHGYVYLLAGNSTVSSTATPTLGTMNSMSGYGRVAAGPDGNLYLARSSSGTTGPSVAFYDLSTGFVREFVAGTGTVQGSVIVPPGTTATTVYTCTTPGMGDGQPALSTSSTYSAAALSTGICFENNGTGNSQLTLAADANNNLYIGDVEIDSAGYGRSRIRKVLATQLSPTTSGAPSTQTLFLHGPASSTVSATAIAASALDVPASEISVAAPVCATTANADMTGDCLAVVTFAPTAPGLRTANLELSEPSLSVTSNFPLYGLATGSALVTDPASPIAPVTTSLAGASAVPVGVAVDSNGDIFTMDTAAGKFTEISGGTTRQLAGTLPTNPAQLALNLAGNVRRWHRCIGPHEAHADRLDVCSRHVSDSRRDNSTSNGWS